MSFLGTREGLAFVLVRHGTAEWTAALSILFGAINITLLAECSVLRR